MGWSLDKTLAVDFDSRRYFDTSNDGKYVGFLNSSNTFKVYNTAIGEDMGWDIPDCYFIRFKIINSPESLGGTFLVAIKEGYYKAPEDQENAKIIFYQLESNAWVEKGSYQKELGWPPQQERLAAQWYPQGRTGWNDEAGFEYRALRIHPLKIIESGSGNGYIYLVTPSTFSDYAIFTINTNAGSSFGEVTLKAKVTATPFMVMSESLPKQEMFFAYFNGNVHILDLDKAPNIEGVEDLQPESIAASAMHTKTFTIDTTALGANYSLNPRHFVDGRMYKTSSGTYKAVVIRASKTDFPIYEYAVHSFDYDPVQKTLSANDHMILGESHLSTPNIKAIFTSETSSLTQISIGPQRHGDDAGNGPVQDTSHLNKTIHIDDEGKLQEVAELQKAYPSILFPELVREWTQIGQDIDGEAESDQSGESVSLNSNGNIVAIGARFNDDNGRNSGHVRVYEYDGETWTQIGQDIDGEAKDDKSGWSVSLNSDGTIVAIGAYGNDGSNGQDSGHVRVYEYDGETWTKIGQDIDGEASGDESGYSVSLNSNGNIVAIGAYRNHNTNGGEYSGHVRVYEYDGETWTKIGQDIDGEASSDVSGQSVSLNSDGTIVAIGAVNNHGNAGAYSGHVRVYQYQSSSNAWTKIGQDIDGEAEIDQSGYSVSLNSDGTIVAIGAPYNDGNENNSGHVRVHQYQSTSDTWTQIGRDIDGEAENDASGVSVSLNSDGTIVAIGAINNHGNAGAYSGHVRVYEYDGETWTKIGQDIDGEALSDVSGQSVSLNSDGTIVAIGAHGNDGNGEYSGHVRVYQLT